MLCYFVFAIKNQQKNVLIKVFTLILHLRGLE